MSRICYLLTIFFVSSATHAATMDEEIQFLLDDLDTENCSFVRNETPYSTAEFRLHLESKLRGNRSLVHNTEDFIEKIATRSASSGAAYVAVCDGELKIIEQWFTELLAEFRQAN